VQRLYPRPGETSAAELVGQLDLGSRAPADRPYVVVNMVSTLDGRAATDGDTRGLGGDQDRELFHLLRTADDLPLLLARLRADHGIRSLICEGGPTLVSYMLAAGLIDELFLSLAPKLAGGGDEPTITQGPALHAPADAELVWLCEAEGELFTRWRVRH